jgi:hypothetical protein
LKPRPASCYGAAFDEPNLYLFRFGIPLVLKRTERTFNTEAHALHYLNRVVPQLPIPKLIDNFQLGDETWTLMSRLPGSDLQELEERTPEQMEVIAKDVIAIVDELWRIPQPLEYKGQVMRSASGHGMRHPVTLLEKYIGPYESTYQCY